MSAAEDCVVGRSPQRNPSLPQALNPRLGLRPFALLWMSALAVWGLGCASQALKPGTGDISFRLQWQGPSDLDLHVLDPIGRETGIMGRPTAYSPEEALKAMRARLEQEQEQGPKGLLDVDCNGSPEKMCDRPMENIYWPQGSAFEGSYETWVYLFQPLTDPELEIPFTVQVRLGNKVVKAFSGTVSNAERQSGRFSYAY